MAVERWDLGDVTAAVEALIVGDAPGVHRGFLPTSAELGGECRRQHGLRVDKIERHRRLHPPRPERLEPNPPESVDRVKAMVDQYVAEHKPEGDFERDLYWTGKLPPKGGRRHVA